MRRILLLILVLVSASFLTYAQTTLNPRVDSQYMSEYGSGNIVGVDVNEESTMVMIEYITPRNFTGLWISFSANTVLTYQNCSERIRSWGVVSNGEFYLREFDQQYSLKADRKYLIALIFPKIPSSVKVCSIRENTPQGFFWNGIHLEGTPSSGYNDNRSSDNHQIQEDIEASFSPTGSGTCFAINKDGYLATCYHVVEGASEFRIRGVGDDFDKLYKARLVSTDKANDLAILKIEDGRFDGFDNIPYCVSDRLAEVGEEVYVLGYPLRPIMGDEIKLTDGLVSSLSGYLGDQTAYQVSATVQMGNSGGPLLDKYGNVVGVVNARLFVESASYAVKGSFLKNMSINSGVALNNTNTIKNLSLSEKVKQLKKFIFVIEVR